MTYSRASLNVELARKLLRFTEHVPGTAHCVQQRFVKIAVNLGPQATDVHVDDVSLGVKVVIPDIFKQHGAGYDLTTVAHEVFEKPEFPGLQSNRLIGSLHLSRKHVHLKISNHKLCRQTARTWTPSQCLDARQQVYPQEAPYRYQPFVGLENEYRFNATTAASVIKDYNLKDLSI